MQEDYSKTGDILLKNQNTLRKLVGVLGMMLPVCLYIFLLVDGGFSLVLPSISHYYFTRACGVLLICVGMLAIFLLIYKGEERKDNLVSSLAGAFALLVLLFPTNNLLGLMGGKFDIVNVTILKDSDFRPKFHYFSAAIFLGSLAYMAFFLFTKSNLPPEKRGIEKIRRNRIYRVCGVIMVIAMAVIFAGFLGWIPADVYDENNLTFWMEVLAVESFGFAWMVKGEFLFKDKMKP